VQVLECVAGADLIQPTGHRAPFRPLRTDVGLGLGRRRASRLAHGGGTALRNSASYGSVDPAREAGEVSSNGDIPVRTSASP
jgi:hypothetical protein